MKNKIKKAYIFLILIIILIILKISIKHSSIEDTDSLIPSLNIFMSIDLIINCLLSLFSFFVIFILMFRKTIRKKTLKFIF